MHFQSDLTLSMSVEHPMASEDDRAELEMFSPLSPDVITLDIPATLTSIHLLCRCACGLVEGVTNLVEPAINLYNLELALQEVAVNIVKHAYAHSEGRIQMTLHLEPQPVRLTILLRDTGASFDPSIVPQPKLGELQEHGFGLFLVRQLMDEVVYRHNAGGNLWKLVKTFPTEE